MKITYVMFLSLISMGVFAGNWDTRIECFGENRDIIIEVNDQTGAARLTYSKPPYDEYTKWSIGEANSDIEKDVFSFDFEEVTIYSSFGYSDFDYGTFERAEIQEEVECRWEQLKK